MSNRNFKGKSNPENDGFYISHQPQIYSKRLNFDQKRHYVEKITPYREKSCEKDFWKMENSEFLNRILGHVTIVVWIWAVTIDVYAKKDLNLKKMNDHANA